METWESKKSEVNIRQSKEQELMNKKILYIGWCMPYDHVQHAGGKTFNDYVKKMAACNDVKVISFAEENEVKKATLQKYGISTQYLCYKKSCNLLFKKIFSIGSRVSTRSFSGGLIAKYKAEDLVRNLKKLKQSNYYPDVIVLQWTQIVVLVDMIKNVYPNSKIVGVEEDVTFLRLYREYKASNGISAVYKRAIYHNEKQKELKALEKCDLVYVYNKKDRDLLLSSGLKNKNLKVLVPYYHKYDVLRNKRNKDILFFGDMGRPENYNAAIEFITDILPNIKTKGARFIVLGGNSEKIKPYESDNVIVTGYVEKPDTYFADSAVFVAPLKLGAGIKVKILEAMSSGIPVITTDVGIEGIPAVDRKSFYFYSTKEELIQSIDDALNNPKEAELVGLGGKNMVEKEFDYHISTEEYIKTLMSL